MKALLVGSGAREHAIAENLVNSGAKIVSFLSGKNPGLIKLSESWKQGDICDTENIKKFALKHDVSLAVIGPEAPLASGVVDSLISDGIDCIGPRKSLARLESDKAFARTLMQTYKIGGCPEFHTFQVGDDASKFILSSDKDWAIKPVGLTGGKGVKILGEHLNREEAAKYAKEIVDHRIGGAQMVVIEERLIGQEVTIQAFTDGKVLAPMPAVQDHKRAFDGDIGPNTGGMGSYSDSNHLLPFLDKKTYDECTKIMEQTVQALYKQTSFYYKGIIYGQFMLTKDGPKVIEFNVRFGDPEAMNVLPLLETNSTDLYKAIAHGELDTINVKFSNKATVCKYAVPEGYPDEPHPTSVQVDPIAISNLGARFYWASVNERSHKIMSTKSRTAATLGLANTIPEAGDLAEKALSHIQGKLFHRKDIGTQELLNKRLKQTKEVSGQS